MALKSQHVLIEQLNQLPQFKHKTIKVLPSALGGYKQPQQLMSLTYMLSLGMEFDLIINIDGFNEVALPVTENIKKDVNPFFPRNWYGRVGMFDDTMISLRDEYRSINNHKKFVADFFSLPIFRHSITFNTIWLFYDSILQQKLLETKQTPLNYKLEITKDQYLVTGPEFHFSNNEEIYDNLADLWKNTSIQMHRLSQSNGIPYFHFLQPNQYVEGSKPLHPDELKNAYDKDQPYRTGVIFGYPKLIEASNEIKQAGINFHDLTGFFENNSDPLYKDDCCHMHNEGYELLMEHVAEQVVKYYYDKDMISSNIH